MASHKNQLCLATWNVKGLGNPIKRKKVMLSLKSKKYDIVFMQECHMSVGESQKLRGDWVGWVYCSPGTSQSRGVITLINKHVQFNCLKEARDGDGRIMVVLAEIQGQALILANSYAPNVDNPEFFTSLESILHDLGDYPIIWAGDMNVVMDRVLDRSCPGNPRVPRSVNTLKSICDSLCLVDAWRLLNPTGRDYTFYSPPHSMFSRIDYFFLSKSLVPSMLTCSIGNLLISDHAPVSLVLASAVSVERTPRWRFNSSLLQDHTFKDRLKGHIDMYIAVNLPSAPSAGVVWEALKAYIRGIVIQHASFKKKLQLERLSELERLVRKAEKDFKQDMSPSNLQTVTQLKFEYNSILTEKVEFGLFRARQKYFESGDKAGKLLASYIKHKELSSSISSVQSMGSLLTKPVDINNAFREFYKGLYTSATDSSQEEMVNFLNKLNLPTLNLDQREMLDAPITEEEIRETILNMPSGKAPGPDGFTTEFFKCFCTELSPLLLSMYTEALDKGVLPPTLSQALISLILKKDKDPADCNSYRPISLISVDVKILSKILANRLQGVLADIIHPDQVGFIQGRYSTDNIRRLIDIMWIVRNDDTPTAAISLDAEKAFDSVEWSYLFSVLEAFGFGPVFINWVKLLYKQPVAAIQTNGLISPYFKLGRGTRQGCPLSPAMFCLAIEPLAVAVRQNPNFPGVAAGGSAQKLMLFADDILLFVTDPANSIPALLSTIHSFSRFSGYKINWSKSEALSLTAFCPHSLFQSGSFQWPVKGIRYLGILFPQKISDIVKVNFDPLLENISTDVDRWSSLYLSLWGKVNVLKMNCIPRINYFLSSLPIFVNPTYFKRFERICNAFLWNGRRPRMRLGKLYLPVDRGGLGLPNLALFYYAYSLRHVGQWLLPPERAPPWLAIEQSLSPSLPLVSLLTTTLSSAIQENPIFSHLQGVWRKVSHILGVNPHLSGSASLWSNPKLQIAKSPVLWREWVSRGILFLDDLFEDNTLLSFELLKDKFGLNNNQFWRYLQLRHMLVSVFGTSSGFQSTDALKKILGIFGSGHEAAQYYSLLINQSGDKAISALKAAWENDLGLLFTEDKWAKIVGNSKQMSRDIKTRLIQFKILHRFYWTPSRLHRLGLKDTPVCWRCKTAEGSLIHMLWSCPRIQLFWEGVHNHILELMGEQIDLCPSLYILGDSSPLSHLSKSDSLWIQTAIMLGRQIIMRVWKSPVGPSVQDWLLELGKVAAYEKLSFRLLNRLDSYYDKWGKFLDYFKVVLGGT